MDSSRKRRAERLTVGVDGGERIVKENEIGVEVKSSGDVDSLTLSSREVCEEKKEKERSLRCRGTKHSLAKKALTDPLLSDLGHVSGGKHLVVGYK